MLNSRYGIPVMIKTSMRQNSKFLNGIGRREQKLEEIKVSKERGELGDPVGWVLLLRRLFELIQLV